MAKRRQKAAGRGLKTEELRAQEGLELPERHAMSLLGGMPSLDGGGMLGAPVGGTTPTDGTAPAGGTTPTDSGTPTTGATPTDTSATDSTVPILGGSAAPGTDPGPAAEPGPTTEPGPTSGDTQTFAPVNRATVLNQLANGSAQGAGASQTSPINQST